MHGAVENGVLVFANESDLSQFKSYMIQLDKVTKPTRSVETTVAG